jgi:transglutaminase-like putative cysteine protease
VSRRRFRARVALPRPVSAWLLVTVASATLWITQQLSPTVVAVQLVLLGLSLWRRERPFGWQRSSTALNLGMIAIAAVTVMVGLRGQPSTIALAHFAALTQGLQLLDARPRHTEFLLVTLALFQVVLASNLTDSVFFPPLLAAFVFAAVWTLLVHPLRTERIQAGDAAGVGRAITPGLGPALATAGFSDRVTLGDLGRIRQDSTVVMRVETLEGAAPSAHDGYWKGLAFDHFDGVTWSITPPGRALVPGSAEGGVSLGRGPERVDLVQRIVREPVEAGVLFAPGRVRRLQGTVRRLERDTSGGLYAVGQAEERVRYTVSAERSRPRESQLRRDRALPARHREARDLQLPSLSAEVSALAGRIVEARGTDAERVRAVEQHLLQNGRYTNLPPQVGPDDPRSPVEAFLLGGLAGHCEYFATSMVLLLRSVGIPARLVNGFAGGRENAIGGFLEITRSDAHTWVEVHFAEAGWVRYDPTPADLRARPPVALSLGERLRQLGSAVELWWFQRVVGFDRADQIQALKRAWLAWRGMRGGRSALGAPDIGASSAAFRAALRTALPGLAGLAALVLLLAWRGRAAASGPAVPRAYREALRLLARRGLVRTPCTTASDFARAVEAAQPEAVSAPFGVLTRAYLEERFGGRAPRQASGALAQLREGLRRQT